MRKTVLPFAALLFPAMLTGLSGCSTNGKDDPLAGGGGLAGRWVSGDNVFSAEMNDGSFTAIANDTGNILSQGSYIVLSASEVKLDWRGNVTGQENTAVCTRPDVGTLNCRDQAGKTFVLRKTG